MFRANEYYTLLDKVLLIVLIHDIVLITTYLNDKFKVGLQPRFDKIDDIGVTVVKVCNRSRHPLTRKGTVPFLKRTKCSIITMVVGPCKVT